MSALSRPCTSRRRRGRRASYFCRTSRTERLTKDGGQLLRGGCRRIVLERVMQRLGVREHLELIEDTSILRGLRHA